MKSRLLVFVICTCGTLFAQYGRPSSREFMSNCEIVADTPEGQIGTLKGLDREKVIWCVAYLAGFWDSSMASSAQLPFSSTASYRKFNGDFCWVGQLTIPTMQQDAKTVVTYIRQHPYMLKVEAIVSVVRALREIYPCPKDSIPDKPRK